MKKMKRKLFIAISELLIVVLLFSGATFAFFQITTTLNVDQAHLRVQTVSELLVRNMDDPLDEFGNQLVFNLDLEEEIVYDEVTTVDGVNFFYQLPDFNVAEGNNYLIRNFSFWAPSDLDVFLTTPGEVFETNETTESMQKVVNVLRVGFIPFVLEDDGQGGEIKVFEEPPISIYSRVRESTFVYQDLNFQEVEEEVTNFFGETQLVEGIYVQNFTQLGVGGEKVFSVTADEERFVRIVIWVEGNDPNSTAAIAEANFSVYLQLSGVASS